MSMILVVCPQAVGSSWHKTVSNVAGFTPWPHQHDIAGWMANRRHGLISADMGTGKTLTALMSSGAWGAELVPVDITTGTGKQRAERLKIAATTKPSSSTLVVIVNYESVWRGEVAKFVEQASWLAVILDESHRIKSPGGRASRWLARFASKQRAAKRLCLTGTPMPQGPLDLYGQFRFLSPDVYGTSFARFRARYAECDIRFPSKVNKYRNMDEFSAKLDAHSYRIMADDVLDLPDAIHERLEVDLSPKAMKVYTALEHDLTASIEGGTVTVANALSKMLRLQQVTSGHLPTDEGGVAAVDGVPTKRRLLEDRLSDLHVTEPVVVFCRFREDLRQVAAAARELGREYSEVSGERKDLQRWQDGDSVILGVQIQSGGVGIDCSRAAYAFYYSLGFSLGDYEQSLARLRRPGQARCVRYYHLVAKNTVDEKVYAALKARKNVIESVMEKLTSRKVEA